MCGIAGLFDVRGALAAPDARDHALRAMALSLQHRGPDDQGFWHDPAGRCSLAHRRLSIIDTSSAGHQPMRSADDRWVISYNGEIYNFLELRAELEAVGCRFVGRTDTEVLLQALRTWGTDALARLDGMFAFATFDRSSGELLLARDAFGEKPLYYVEVPGGGLAFASELQALELLPGLDLTISADAIGELLMFQYVGAPRTIYREVRKLPPAHWLRIAPDGKAQLGRYYRFAPGESGFEERPLGVLADELEELLVRSLRRRLISDVPLGAFLSGGVDSSTVCALIRRRLDVPLKTYSIGFEGADESEHAIASAFARHLGTEHHEKMLAPDASDFLLHIGGLLDEPNADSSCLPTYLLSAFARESVTVALSGDGGDEMFCGYGRYFMTLDEAQSARRARGWHPGRAYYSNRILVSEEPHVAEILGVVPDGTRAHLERLRDELAAPGLPLHCLLRRSDVENYMPGAVLPKVDRMSMQHSLEVRTPFLNVELARFAERLALPTLYDGKRGKLVLREIAYRYLPRELVDRPKQGFGLPMSRWARDALLGTAGRLLDGDDSCLAHLLGRAPIERFMARQRSEHGFATYQVWAVAMLESWLRERAKQRELRADVAPIDIAPPAAPRPPLHLHPLAGRLVAVSADPALTLTATPGEPGAAVLWREELLRLALRLPETVGELARPPHGEPATLPSWDLLATAPLERAAERLLDRAILVLPATDLAECAGWAELERLRQLGVVMLVASNPHGGDRAVFALRLARPGPVGEFLRAVRLRRAGIRVPDNDNVAARDGLLRVTGPLPSFRKEPRELVTRYMLFEDNRQMPPVPSSHGQIARRGGGRYSIWSDDIYYAASSDARQAAGRRLLECTPETERLLPYVPRALDAVAEDTPRFTAALRDWIGTHAAGSAAPPLAAGDRVVVMTHSLPPGGAERQWVYLARELKRRGFDVVFVVNEPLVGDNGHFLPLLTAERVHIVNVLDEPLRATLDNATRDAQRRALHLWPGQPLGALLPQLASLLQRLQPKAVYAQLDFPNVLAGTAALLADVPHVVLSFRNFNPSNLPYLYFDWLRPLYQALAHSPRVHLSGNARLANDDYADWLGIARERVAWIGNALAASDLAPGDATAIARLRAELGLGDTQPVVLGVFRLSAEKRPLLFVEVCAALAQRRPDVRFLLVGIGPMLEDVRNAAHKSGIADRLAILGRRDDVAALMALSDVLLLTSAFEGMPNAVMEAQVLGLPVVASDVGGVRDCLDDGRSGFLVEGASATAYVDAVECVLDPARLVTFRAAARQRAADRFSHARMAEAYLRLAGFGIVAAPPDRAALLHAG